MVGFKNQRGRIKAYRASGKMFGQSMHTDSDWGKGYRPEPIVCDGCDCVMSWYTDPCPCGNTFKTLSAKAEGRKDNHDIKI